MGLFNIYLKIQKTAEHIDAQIVYVHMNELENSRQNDCNSGLFSPLASFSINPCVLNQGGDTVVKDVRSMGGKSGVLPQLGHS